uniref:Uncharacterized protein n=1 Tax=Nymphaea colorata TaxID=210225 RepID=A0A5K1G602_9MAGN
MSFGEEVAGRGRSSASSGKFRAARRPLRHSAATSCARAAISGVGNDPSHILDFFLGSLISDTHRPHRLLLTPLYTGCFVDPPPPPSPPLPSIAGTSIFRSPDSSILPHSASPPPSREASNLLPHESASSYTLTLIQHVFVFFQPAVGTRV